MSKEEIWSQLSLITGCQSSGVACYDPNRPSWQSQRSNVAIAFCRTAPNTWPRAAHHWCGKEKVKPRAGHRRDGAQAQKHQECWSRRCSARCISYYYTAFQPGGSLWSCVSCYTTPSSPAHSGNSKILSSFHGENFMSPLFFFFASNFSFENFWALNISHVNILSGLKLVCVFCFACSSGTGKRFLHSCSLFSKSRMMICQFRLHLTPAA